MNPYVWAALGAALGWILTFTIADKAFASKAESVGAGIFGAVLGGQLQVTMSAAAAPPGFQPATLMGAFIGSVAVLVMLAVFRKAVGPMKPARKKTRGR